VASTPNSIDSLDLYSQVEDMIGVKEAAPRLYAHYLLALNSIEFDSLLDVGCGSGDFLHSMAMAFDDSTMSGIDLSPQMVSRASKIHEHIECIDICDMSGEFDVITATFDMLNYLDRADLERFLGCLTARVSSGGYFMFDINTLYGFEEVAVGSFIAQEDDRFLTIDSDFEDGIYSSEFTLFRREGELYHKSQEQILQHYHTVDDIVTMSGMELISHDEVSLYGDESDKSFVVLMRS